MERGFWKWLWKGFKKDFINILNPMKCLQFFYSIGLALSLIASCFMLGNGAYVLGFSFLFLILLTFLYFIYLLKLHIESVFVCGECGKEFLTWEEVREHKRERHGKGELHDQKIGEG